MQRDKDLHASEDGESGAQNVALEALTRLNDKRQMENFLTYGKWDLKDADIEKLNKEEERKERVGYPNLDTFQLAFEDKRIFSPSIDGIYSLSLTKTLIEKKEYFIKGV